ncbi:FISUMP domain-containing protein [Parasediminibacterium sp. JCM 36343]|uniref:FISUMP domain-containing protein n=1 Tax=Parasediminibacterium sp. JCM 36343 TaxID=3374279 RepID=UPI003978DD12
MKKVYITMAFTLLICLAVKSQTVTDYDNNSYQTVVIGNQTWLKSNLKSTHYADGSAIANIYSYNNDTSNATTYGRLYTWNSAMKNYSAELSQGACPCGWHLPSNKEWEDLAVYASTQTGLGHWHPNLGR